MNWTSTRYELEELMGDSKWERVWESKEESNYSDNPDALSFESIESAKHYVNTSPKWRAKALERGVVRIIKVVNTREAIDSVPSCAHGNRPDLCEVCHPELESDEDYEARTNKR